MASRHAITRSKDADQVCLAFYLVRSLAPNSLYLSSCLKDLATLRDPTSYFTFLSYLHSQNRLPEFINRGTIIPSRREFADYLGWTAQEVVRRGVDVAYGEEVIGISKVLLDEQSLLEVTSRKLSSGETIVRWTSAHALFDVDYSFH